MQSIGKSVIAATALAVLVVSLAACEKKEGPGERAGKDIDKTLDKIGQQVEQAGKEIQDAASGNKK